MEYASLKCQLFFREFHDVTAIFFTNPNTYFNKNPKKILIVRLIRHEQLLVKIGSKPFFTCNRFTGQDPATKCRHGHL